MEKEHVVLKEPVSDFVRVCFSTPEFSQFLPPNLRDEYDRQKVNRLLLLYKDTIEQIGLIKVGTSEKFFRLDDSVRVSGHFARPAKGQGYFDLSIEVNGEQDTIFTSDRYEESHFTWFSETHRKFCFFFGLNGSFEDNGYDA